MFSGIGCFFLSGMEHSFADLRPKKGLGVRPRPFFFVFRQASPGQIYWQVNSAYTVWMAGINPPPLRRGTPRPDLIVDPTNQQARLKNPAPLPPFPGSGTQLPSTVGIPGVSTIMGRPSIVLGFNKGRVVSALPLKDRRLLQAPVLVHDSTIGYLADADGNLLGVPGIWVHRLVSAVSTPSGPRSSAGLQGY